MPHCLYFHPAKVRRNFAEAHLRATAATTSATTACRGGSALIAACMGGQGLALEWMASAGQQNPVAKVHRSAKGAGVLLAAAWSGNVHLFECIASLYGIPADKV